MNPAIILAAMLSLAHVRSPRAGWEATAEIIAHEAHTPSDAAVLLTIAWEENTLVTDGSRGIPFGVSCCYRSDWTPERAAHFALGIMHAGLGECHEMHRAWIRYNTGACRIRPPQHHRESVGHQRMRTRAHRYALRADTRYRGYLRYLRSALNRLVTSPISSGSAR